MSLEVYQIIFVASTLLCSLVAGFLFAFSVVVMPGIRRLSDRAFIETFQAMDGIIQRNQPLFVIVWVGSVVTLLLSAGLGIWQLHGIGRALIMLAAFVYVLGVQLPTVVINIPMNNKLQRLDLSAADVAELNPARKGFESRWNRWNVFRTAMACLAAALLIIQLLLT